MNLYLCYFLYKSFHITCQSKFSILQNRTFGKNITLNLQKKKTPKKIHRLIYVQKRIKFLINGMGNFFRLFHYHNMIKGGGGGVLFNSLPNDKILDWSKLKQIADDILKCI